MIEHNYGVLERENCSSVEDQDDEMWCAIESTSNRERKIGRLNSLIDSNSWSFDMIFGLLASWKATTEKKLMNEKRFCGD